MSMAEEKENIMQLPLPQRTVAVALKHVFDQIKKLEEEESQETKAVHLSFIKKFEAVEQQASIIIKGGSISAEALKEKEKYFTSAQNPQVEELAKNNKGIEAYWLTVFQNFFQDDFVVPDKEIAVAIKDISTKITEDKLELIFQIGPNQWLVPGKFSRRFLLQEGLPIKVEGDKVKWLKKKPESLLSKILDGCQSPMQLQGVFPIVGEIINEMVPYSLQFYLGVTEEGSMDEEDDEGEEQEISDEEQEEEAPKKKVKE